MELIKKKIAVICNYKLLSERVGGMDYFFWKFDQKCKENNIQVDWFFPNKSTHGNYSELNIISSNDEEVELFFAEYIQNASIKYDKIMMHFVELCTSVFKSIKKISNAEIIAIDHNPRPLHGYTVKKIIKKRIKGFLYSSYIDKFIGVSKYTENEILKDFGNHLRCKTSTIYNGVIIDDIIKREKRNFIKPTFLVASHLRKSKGIQDLIDAVSLLPKDLKSKIVIDIYGDGPYKSLLLDQVKLKKVENNFNFLGSKANLKDVFHKYDYMIQPTHMECFSLSILESLAANVPVITTDVGGNEEVITHTENGFIVPAKNINVLKKLLEEIILGKKSITNDTRNLIEKNYSLENMVENYYRLIS